MAARCCAAATSSVSFEGKWCSSRPRDTPARAWIVSVVVPGVARLDEAGDGGVEDAQAAVGGALLAGAPRSGRPADAGGRRGGVGRRVEEGIRFAGPACGHRAVPPRRLGPSVRAPIVADPTLTVNADRLRASPGTVPVAPRRVPRPPLTLPAGNLPPGPPPTR